MLSSSNKSHDLQPVAISQPMLGVTRAGNQLEIHFDGNVLTRQGESLEQICNRRAVVDTPGLVVDDYLHASTLRGLDQRRGE
jgi:hypothetical protein